MQIVLKNDYFAGYTAQCLLSKGEAMSSSPPSNEYIRHSGAQM